MLIFYLYLKKTFHFLFAVLCVIIIIRTFVVEPGIVNGRSMENTFLDNDFYFLNKAVLLFREPKRGEIIQAHPNNEEMNVIKRIIGLPGERLSIHGGNVYLVDKDNKETLLKEPYVKPGVATIVPNNTYYKTRTIPPHSYFIMGDNRAMSTDSREYNEVYRSQIYGVVMKLPSSKK